MDRWGRPVFDQNSTLMAGRHVLLNPEELSQPVLLRVLNIQRSRDGDCPVVVVLDWDGDEESLRRAHKMRAVTDGAESADGKQALGLVLIGPTPGPADLTVLWRIANSWTPPESGYSRWAVSWDDLGRFLSEDAAAAPWRLSRQR